MSRYYKPKMNEFHEGFLYEYKVSPDMELWQTMSFSFGLVSLFPECPTTNPEVRVKYLDREDVESLGLELTQIPGDSFDWEYDIEHRGTGIGSAIVENDGVISELEFFGTIFKVLNKSELIRLLKQLDVCLEKK